MNESNFEININIKKTYNHFIKPCIFQEVLDVIFKVKAVVVAKMIRSFSGGQGFKSFITFHIFFNSFGTIFLEVIFYTHLNQIHLQYCKVIIAIK
jgi:hypothetical protein